MHHSQDIWPFETPKAFIHAVEDALETALVGQGFLRLRKYCLVFPIDDEFDGWIGLSRRTKHAGLGTIELHAGWGIHCPRIERFVFAGRGEKYKRGESCTVSLCESIDPPPRHVRFTAAEDIAQKADEVARFYRHQVVPSMRKHASYDAIIPSLEENADRRGGWDQSLLLAYLFAGRGDQVKGYVQDRLRACAEDEQYAAYYRPFLSRFIEEFGE